MDNQFYIGEISNFFDLPASTLRYWEQSGVLIPNKNTENNYREYTLADLMNISDIIFYKSLGIPLKQIHTMEQSTPEEHEFLLNKKISELEYKKQQIQNCIEKIHMRINAINTLKELKLNSFKEVDIDTECIVSFDLTEIEKLRKYIENPYLYSRVQHSDNIETEIRGLTISNKHISDFPKSQTIWRKNNNKYISCLMKEEVTEGFPNNLSKLIDYVKTKYNINTGFIISRFLLCAMENGKLYDFYKTFIEIIP